MAIPKVSGLNCPNCGAGIEIRSFSNALSVVCASCHSVLDARDPNLRILQEAQSRETIQPDIPLGSRGKFAEGEFEVIGFQQRTTYEEGLAYSWFEYLLFNPYRGFRYLTVYKGHWNYVRTLNTLPRAEGSNVKVGDVAFRLYSNAVAVTTYVLGEFPWQVMVGEQVQVTDYIAPPKVLSAESTPEEIVWSMGDYMTGAQVWQAFKLATPVPQAWGVFENQPSPHRENAGSLWLTAIAMTVLAILVAFGISATGSQREIFRQSFSVNGVGAGSFDLPAGKGILALKTVNRAGAPLYVEYTLTKPGETRPLHFGRRVEPVASGDEATLGSLPPGHYTLSVDCDAPAGVTTGTYDIQIRHEPPKLGWVFPAVCLLLLPPFWKVFRGNTFERERWSGSNV